MTIKVVSSYKRKGNVPDGPDYSMHEAFVAIEEVIEGEVDPEDLQRTIEGQFIQAKSQVFSQLNLNYSQDEETGMLYEVFPGAEVVEARVASTPKRKALKAVPNEEEEYEEPKAAPSRKAARRKPAPPPVEEDDYEDEEEEYEEPAPKRRKKVEPKNDKERNYLDLMNNPGDWKVSTSSNEKAPQWTHKRKKNDRGYALGLWEEGAPDWFVDPFE